MAMIKPFSDQDSVVSLLYLLQNSFILEDLHHFLAPVKEPENEYVFKDELFFFELIKALFL